MSLISLNLYIASTICENQRSIITQGTKGFYNLNKLQKIYPNQPLLDEICKEMRTIEWVIYCVTLVPLAAAAYQITPSQVSKYLKFNPHTWKAELQRGRSLSSLRHNFCLVSLCKEFNSKATSETCKFLVDSFKTCTELKHC